jgi:hypothetical protein
MNRFASREVRTRRRREHQALTQKDGLVDKNRPENDEQKENIAQPIEAPRFLRGFPGANGFGGALEVPFVHDIKHPEQPAQSHTPHRPTLLGHPPKRHAFQIAKKQWRIADRCQTTPHVRHDEDKENNMMRRDAVFVHPNPRTNQQHRSSRRPQHIRDDRAKQQKQNIDHRSRFALYLDMNAAGHDKQRADERNKTDVFLRDM